MRDERDSTPAVVGLRRAMRSRLDDATAEDQGLRERKKRLMRRQISDTATRMFLDRGFDEVRVTEIAAACGVSEKTVYNYFPNKESLVFDQEEEMVEEIERALGPDAKDVSLVESSVSIITRRLRTLLDYAREYGMSDMTMILGFAEMVEGTPALRTAQVELSERVAQAAAAAMAERVGVNPQDPEPQIAADTLLGLWRVYFRSTFQHAAEGVPLERFEELVLDDVRRAARLIDSGLWSFSAVAGGSNSRDQLRVAAEASNEARRQVIGALKEAKVAWKQMKSELKAELKAELRAEFTAPARTPRGDARRTRSRADMLRQLSEERRAEVERRVGARSAVADSRVDPRASRRARASRQPRGPRD